MLKKINFKLICILVNIINFSFVFSAEAITISKIQDIEKNLGLSLEQIQIHKNSKGDNTGPVDPLIIDLYFEKADKTIKSTFPQYPLIAPLKIDSFSFQKINDGNGNWKTPSEDGYKDVLKKSLKSNIASIFIEKNKNNEIFLNLVALEDEFKNNIEESIKNFTLSSAGSLMLGDGFYIKINFDQSKAPIKKTIEESERIILIESVFVFEFSYNESKSNLFLRKRSKIEDFKLIAKDDAEINENFTINNESILKGDAGLIKFSPNQIFIKDITSDANLNNPIQTLIEGKDINYVICNLNGFNAFISDKNLMIKNSKKFLKTPTEINNFISEITKMTGSKIKSSIVTEISGFDEIPDAIPAIDPKTIDPKATDPKATDPKTTVPAIDQKKTAVPNAPTDSTKVPASKPLKDYLTKKNVSIFSISALLLLALAYKMIKNKKPMSIRI